MNRPLRVLQLAAAGSIVIGWGSARAYTAEQAAEGRSDFMANCAVCHGENLRVMPTAVLAAPEFIGRWQGRDTNELLAQLRATMPPEGPGSLPGAAMTQAR